MKPGRDWRATSIEEVPVRIQAQDDFRVQNVELRYAVNGGKWQNPLLVGGVQQGHQSDSLLRLEELGAKQVINGANGKQLVPGDLVSYYAVAKDRKQTVQTDLFMVQVQPFERRFTRRAGRRWWTRHVGDEQGAISERQREILLATWNLQRNDERNTRTREQLEGNAQMLSELQATLAEQARTLADARARVRIPTTTSASRRSSRLWSVRRPSWIRRSNHLANSVCRKPCPSNSKRCNSCCAPNPRSVKYRYRCSAIAPAAAAAGRAQLRRNVRARDGSSRRTSTKPNRKCRTETEKQDLDEAIRKLKELAERQEKLAQERARQQMRPEEQRWRQEQLRREAEDLKRSLPSSRGNSNAQQGQQQQQDTVSSTGQQQGQPQQSAQNGGEPRIGRNRAVRAASRASPRIVSARKSVRSCRMR